MWDCQQCGTRGIAASLLACPGCGARRHEDVPAEPEGSAVDTGTPDSVKTATDDSAPPAPGDDSEDSEDSGKKAAARKEW